MKEYSNYMVCIEACLQCSAVCDHCAVSCTNEPDVKMMAKCIRLDMECAVLCSAAARLMSLDSEQAPAICKICSAVCEACGKECGKHDNAHCRKCSEICRVCAAECRKMANPTCGFSSGSCPPKGIVPFCSDFTPIFIKLQYRFN